MKRSRHSLLFRTLLTLMSLSLFYCLFAVLETVRQINSDHVLGDSQVNNRFSGFPSLASLNTLKNAGEMFQDRTRLQSDTLYRDQGRALKSLPQWRSWKDDPQKYNMTEAKLSAFTQYLGCSDIQTITVIGNIGRGYTKTVHKGIYKGTEIALKSIQIDNEDIKRCVKNPMMNRSIDECFIFAKYKLAKEIIMLQQLQHANIVKVSKLAIGIIS